MPSDLYFMNLFLIFVRVLAVLMTGPIFGSKTIPTVPKIGLAGFLAFFLCPPGARLSAAVTAEYLPFLLQIGQEILTGTLIGFASNLLFSAVGMAASFMGLSVGFRAANMFDPFTTAPTSSLENFYTILAFALFLSINGHHWFLLGLTKSFELTPVGTFILKEITVTRLLAFTAETLVVALRLSLPVSGALLLTDVSLGLLARVVPQIQVFFLGLPLKMGLGLLILALTLSVFLPYLKELMGGIEPKMLAIIGS